MLRISLRIIFKVININYKINIFTILKTLFNSQPAYLGDVDQES